MKVIKNNRVLTVDETDKDFYLKQGYDVVELDEKTKTYNVVQEATGGRTYSVAEYSALKEENRQLKEKMELLKKDSKTKKKKTDATNVDDETIIDEENKIDTTKKDSD